MKKMKKIMQRILCAAAAMAIAFGFIPLQAQATTTKYAYKVVTLEQDTVITAKEFESSYDEKTDTDTETFYLYRIKVPANGYVRIQTSTSYPIHVYRTYDKNADIYSSPTLLTLEGKKTYYKVLGKGTYYLQSSTGARFKWSFVKAKNTTNFCKVKASPLASGKKFIQVMNQGYEYDRWYKLSVPVSKTIQVSLKVYDDAEPLFALYNSKGIAVKCPRISSTDFRTEKVAAGTYYLRVSRDSDDSEEEDYFCGRIASVSWK